MPETIGLDIGSHSIKLVGLKKTSKGPFLTCFGLRRIPQGINREDLNSVAGVLKDLIEEVCPKTRRVRLTVSGSGIHIRRMTMPSIPKREITQALPWEIKDHLPFPVESARIQYHILGEFVEEGTKKLDLLIVACPETLIERTLAIAREAGLEVEHLGVSAFALWNMLLASDQLKIGETVALIDIGSEKMTLYLFKDENLQFSREMRPAGADLTRAILDGIPFERDLAFLYEKAETIKEEVGVFPEPKMEKELDETLDLAKISFLMRPVLEKWAAEISRSLDYYRNQFYAEKVDRILLAGGGAHLKNLTPYLEGELHLRVEIFNPLRDILRDAKSEDARTLNDIGAMLIASAGVAISSPKRIEFLPVREPFWAKIPLDKSLLILIPLLTALIFLGIIGHTNSQVASLRKERDEKMTRVTMLEDLRTKLTALKGKEIKIKQDLSVYPSSVVSKVSCRKVLQEVIETIPSNVTLTSLEILSEPNLITKSPQTSTLQGKGIQEEKKVLHLGGLAFGSDVQCLTALAQMIEGLERSSLFSNVKLVATEEDKMYNQSAVGFDMVCDIDSPSQEKAKKKE